jgi:integrase/recombinase XerD
MSGGPYGRGKAPARACLPLESWPEMDLRLWRAACEPVDLLALEDGGRRAQHARASNDKAVKGYGRWLTFVAMREPDVLALAPGARITPARVSAYVGELQALGNGSGTILARLQELGEVAKVMGPGLNWGFINRIAAKIRARHRPVRDKGNLRLSEELLDLGLRLIGEAAHKNLTPRQSATMHRDGLLIAFLSLVPLRRKNLARLTLGVNLIDLDGAWLLVLEEAETKTHQLHEALWPDDLVAPLTLYLERHRPHLASLTGRWAKPVGDLLWVSSDGSPMTEMAIYDRIRARTKQAFGEALNPHLFRDAAATTLAIADPEHVRVAAPLLGHRTFATTEKYYQQATAMQAHRTYVAVLFAEENKP